MAAGGKRVLRYGDGSARFGDPDLYLPPGLAARLAPNSELADEITKAVVTSVAAAMTTAAAKSAATGRATQRLSR